MRSTLSVTPAASWSFWWQQSRHRFSLLVVQVRSIQRQRFDTISVLGGLHIFQEHRLCHRSGLSETSGLVHSLTRATGFSLSFLRGPRLTRHCFYGKCPFDLRKALVGKVLH